MADATAGAEKFYSVASVASGLTMSESKDLNKSLGPHWQDVNSTRIGRKTVSQMPPSLEWTDGDVPDVWIEPKNSIILTIKASELVKSSTSRTESTLRFPRVTNIRSDKPWNECMTLEEFNQMCDVSFEAKL
jgi:DNA ligase 4